MLAVPRSDGACRAFFTPERVGPMSKSDRLPPGRWRASWRWRASRWRTPWRRRCRRRRIAYVARLDACELLSVELGRRITAQCRLLCHPTMEISHRLGVMIHPVMVPRRRRRVWRGGFRSGRGRGTRPRRDIIIPRGLRAYRSAAAGVRCQPGSTRVWTGGTDRVATARVVLRPHRRGDDERGSDRNSAQQMFHVWCPP